MAYTLTVSCRCVLGSPAEQLLISFNCTVAWHHCDQTQARRSEKKCGAVYGSSPRSSALIIRLTHFPIRARAGDGAFTAQIRTVRVLVPLIAHLKAAYRGAYEELKLFAPKFCYHITHAYARYGNKF
jgi:hypothetical protein